MGSPVTAVTRPVNRRCADALPVASARSAQASAHTENFRTMPPKVRRESSHLKAAAHFGRVRTQLGKGGAPARVGFCPGADETNGSLRPIQHTKGTNRHILSSNRSKFVSLLSEWVWGATLAQ